MERKYRLQEQADFQRTRREGKCWSHRLVVVCVLRNERPHSRFGFAVSKRVGKATARNRVRRRLREAVRRDIQRIASGWDMVFIARQPVTEADYGEVVTAVREVLGRAGVWPVTVDCATAMPVGTGR
jgi:ribonuclease P protein component